MTLVTGGTTSTTKIGTQWYRTHIFTASTTATVDEAGAIRYLIVGGGGGGGTVMGGGGGAGGVLTGTTTLSTTGIYSIVIGAGGTGAAAGLGAIGTSGTISVWNGLFAIGGGWGASAITANPFPAGSGGSGGGASGGIGSGASFGSVAGSGISGQGFTGGTSGVQWYPAGGGGAGAAGTGGGTSRGTGGLGRLDDILGTPIYWGGGGGGAGYSNYGGNGGDGGGGGGAAGNVSGGGNAFSFANRLGAGDIGGGGPLNTTQNNPGGNGAPNTGGGGGGGGYLTSAIGAVNTGGFGGSGIVVLSYTIADPGPPTATGGTSYIVRQSGLFYRVHVFTQSANFDVTQGGGIEYLVVGGGGSGGARYGGGGGGGGVISGQAIISSGTYAIVVGAGAVGAQTDTVGSTGSNSTFAGVGVTAQGGGAGGGFVAGAYSAGGRGASGGGGGTLAGTASQHYSGGIRSGNNAGGGGGAAGVGADGGGSGGAGGAGLQNLILGGTTYTGLRWGAGGGGGASGAAAGAGGLGGGGGGGASSTAANAGAGGTGGFSPGQSGVSNTFGANNGGSGGANTGAGGGGGGERDTGFYTGGVGGNGGSGIVIIRYQIPTPTYTTGTGGVESLYELNPGEWYKLHTFSTNSVFTSTQNGFVQYLVVGGGGGGGTGPGGGGGAGGFQTGFLNITSGTYSIVIGQGGSGSTSTSIAGNSGTVSSFSTIVVQGGGGGASTTATTTATVGGSGAGGAGSVGPDRRLGSANIVDQGQRGGDGYFDATTSTNSAAGGGGGDATPGMKAGWQIGGRGGDGFLTVITGTSYYFAGGGGGGVSSSTAVVGVGGLGGGGRGGFASTASAISGTPGTGAGGGGGGLLTFGGDGGSGFVALAYALVATPTVTAIVGTSAVTMFAGLTATITPVSGTGGVGPRSFSISPSLPSSLLFNVTNGQITGSINQIFRANGLIQTGTYSVTVTDNVNAKATGTFTLTEIHLPEPIATGGTITTATTGTSIFRIHSFYQSGLFSINTTTAIDYIVVAGGGGGGSNMGGGGGGGGYLEGTGTVITSTASWNIIIGAGGAGAPAGSGQVAGSRGGSTAILFTGTSTLKVFSWSFDGTGDVVSAPTIIAISSGAFTLEGWVYNHRLKNNSTLWTTRPDSGTYADAYHFSWDASGVPSLNIGGTLYAAGAAGSIVAGAWQHVVCVRNSSGVVGIFVNGTRVGYQTGVTAAINRTLIGLGDFPTTPSQGLEGFISNARITSSAVYDPTLPTLTVPSQPLTAVSNVITLWCQDLAIQDNSGNLLTLTRTGDVTFSHFSPYLTLSAVGGGGGASEYSVNTSPGTSGGSGGGVASNASTTFGVGVPGQGNSGGASGGTYYPSGGGGAATAGSNTPGNGGAGRLNNILGPAYYWAGGGGGAGYTGNPGNGGLGGGGGGAPRQGTTSGIGDINAVNPGQDAGAGTLVTQANVPGGNGGLGTGGGGGGGSHFNVNNNGGSGGSGIVAIRYKIGTIGLSTFYNITGTQYLNFYIANSGITPVGARNGYTPYTYSISPTLPLGLTFSTSTGIITGQPNESTFRSYTITVTDANSSTSSLAFSLLTNVQPNYTLDGQADTEISFTVINQVPFLERVAPQINYIKIGDRTLRTADRAGTSQRDFEVRATGIQYVQSVAPGGLEQRLYNNFGNALRKSIVVTARQTVYGFNTSTFPNITRVGVGIANTNTVNTFLSSSTNFGLLTPVTVRSAANERLGNAVINTVQVPNNTRQVSTSLYTRTAFTVNQDYVRGHTLTNTLLSSSTQIYLNVQARIVGITTVSGRTNIVGTYHQSFGTGLSRTTVRSGVNTARFTSTNIQLMTANSPNYIVTVNPKQFFNRSITNVTTVTTTATFIFLSRNTRITYDPIRFSFKGSLAPNTYPGPGAYKSGSTILIETDNAYAASSPISPTYGPLTVVNVVTRGWGLPTNPLRSFSSSTVLTVPVTVTFNPVARSTLTNNSRLLTATNLITSIPFNIGNNPAAGSTATNRLISTSTNFATLVPVNVVSRAGTPNYTSYSRIRSTTTLMVSVPFNISQNPVAGSTVTNTLLTKSTNRYSLGVSSTSGQVTSNLVVPITGRAVTQIQIGQAPSPLTFNINDRSYNYTILNGRVTQITNANDPTLVTVRVPVYVKGLTGQPTQVWFS